MYPAWSEAEERRLIALYDGGARPAELARELDRTARAASLRVHTLRARGEEFQRRDGCPWTEQDDRRLLELYRAGATTREIARELNRTVSGVGWRLQILRERGLAPAGNGRVRRWTDEEDRQLIELYERGTRPEEISRLLKRSVTALHTRLHKLRRRGQVLERRHDWSREEDRRLIDLFTADFPVGEIARELDRSLDAVNHRIKRLRKNGVQLTRKPSPMRNRWREDEERRMIELLNAGVPRAEIARQLNRTPLAVTARINKLH